jgi:AAA15 family ATPase/GTPase
MLIDFSVANYRSFRERQTLSLVAAPKLRRSENTFDPNLAGDPIGRLLKVAVIYGPNASGKSNLIEALSSVRQLVNSKAALTRDLPVQPFRFDSNLANKPSEFEINFIAKDMRFRFEIAATRERIVSERLLFFPKGKETSLYERTYLDGSERYSFGSLLEGGPTLHEAWQKLTSPKHLFLAQAAQNSSEELTQLKTPQAWLEANLMTTPAGGGMKFMTRVLQMITRNYEHHPFGEMAQFIRSLDIPVTSVRFKSAEGSSDAPLERSEPDHDAELQADVKATLTHETRLGAADFEFEEESEGTQNLLGFYVLWQMLQNGPQIIRLLSIDELDSSLHPQIVVQLIKNHLSAETPHQLIFTTHDTHLMDARILRRDQFWLTERDENGATQLRSIHEFKGRESEDIEKRYYEGRYRGLPILREQ